MIRASIDIGTNTVLLLVVDVNNGIKKIILEEQRIPRLGKNVDTNKNLDDESIDRVLQALKEYKFLLEDRFAEYNLEPIVTATSAVRDASNRQNFMDRVFTETGWIVHLLSGDKEAQTTFNGALSVLDELEIENKETLVIDIGGGSTEFALGNVGVLENAQSLNMGSVRFTERFFKSLPPSENEIQKLTVQVQDRKSVV